MTIFGHISWYGSWISRNWSAKSNLNHYSRTRVFQHFRVTAKVVYRNFQHFALSNYIPSHLVQHIAWHCKNTHSTCLYLHRIYPQASHFNLSIIAPRDSRPTVLCFTIHHTLYNTVSIHYTLHNTLYTIHYTTRYMIYMIMPLSLWRCLYVDRV